MIKTTGFKRFLLVPSLRRPRTAWEPMTIITSGPAWAHTVYYNRISSNFLESRLRQSILNRQFANRQNQWRSSRYKGRL